MMLRAMWSGAISFGLVGIPVRAIAAQSSGDLKLELIHRKCRTRLATRKFCPACGVEVPEQDAVRAFQYTKGSFVTLEPEELEQLSQPAKHTLQIEDFVDIAEVDPIYFEKPYFLQPGKGGEKTYALLHRAMTETGRVGIGKVAFRDREHLALIRPLEHALIMETLSFPDEVRSLDDAVAPTASHIDNRELAMATSLINALTAKFNPEKYHDDYKDELLGLVQSKVEGGETRPIEPGAASAAVGDLMDLMRKSVDALKTAGDAANAAPGPHISGVTARKPAHAKTSSKNEKTGDKHRAGRKPHIRKVA